MRIAAIDIGTNSVHMIVVRVRPDLSFEVIDREKAMVRLGAGGLDGKELTTEAMTAALQALSKFKRLAESHTVDVILAAATSATREARNGGEFLARIEAETGIRPRVVTGAEEARLIHLAAVYGVDVGSARAVVIDIGGGSTEITLGTATSTQAAKSFKIGVIRLTERFVKSDPLSGRDEQKLTKHVLSEIDRHCEQITATGFDRVIGTSGTILSLGTVATAIADGAVPSELRNLRVSRETDSTTAQGSSRALAGTATDASRASIHVARIWLSPAACCSTRSCADWAPRTSRCAISHCVKGWCSTTSAATASTSSRSTASLMCGDAAHLNLPSGATTTRNMRSRSCGWRWRSSIRRGRCTA